ncbi:MAG: type II toxin-antitoxin system VapC family toxin [Nanoarchaeota archaeon]|nr:MAG: type II toxin-antitoxin system VapC family toxin [Nanoarchaeota archaeon]
MILDTNFVIDMFKGVKDAVEKAEQIDKTSEPIFITAITIFELWQGKKDHKKNEKLSQFIEAFGLLSLDAESAKLGGDIQADLISRGMRVDSEDCMIAGIALKNNQTVVTNDEHFSRMKGLRTQSY